MPFVLVRDSLLWKEEVKRVQTLLLGIAASFLFSLLFIRCTAWDSLPTASIQSDAIGVAPADPRLFNFVDELVNSLLLYHGNSSVKKSSDGFVHWSVDSRQLLHADLDQTVLAITDIGKNHNTPHTIVQARLPLSRPTGPSSSVPILTSSLPRSGSRVAASRSLFLSRARGSESSEATAMKTAASSQNVIPPPTRAEAIITAIVQGIAAGAVGAIGASIADSFPLPGQKAASVAGPATVAAGLAAAIVAEAKAYAAGVTVEAPERKAEAYKESFLQGAGAALAGFIGSTLADPFPLPGARAASTAGPATVAAVLVAKRKDDTTIAIKDALTQGAAAAVAAFVGGTLADPFPLPGEQAASVAGPATVAAGLASAVGITEAEAAVAGFAIGLAAAARAEGAREKTAMAQGNSTTITKPKSG